MPLPPHTPALPRTLARDAVYRRLQDWIVNGTLAPGEQLRDLELAEAFGVSRTPVREALQRLEDEGFVVTAKNRWTRVAPLETETADQLYPLVEALEVLALELALPRLTPGDLEALKAAQQRLEAALLAGSGAAALEADDAFHAVLPDRAANPELVRTLTRFKTRLRRLELAYFQAAAPGDHSLAEHRQILAALHARDLEMARNALRGNWRSSLARLKSRLPSPTGSGN
ncbi:DNA-binding GntR family transcriptional regulator [Deinobacterium chartae]|uniref:DNA-binding GntR family transcriptional regulator n=1 Tax=Deinobacterium chartae TaxID=521158 RepID=A0A841I864_9DEIO|nr:GntR family transcriptional regulator [Deinobacterium chartae]MBB6099985.1 DNA-binding GntR family transcriptional regulator [Deinobacterium chartae]